MFDHTTKLSFRATVNEFDPFVKARHPFETSFAFSPFECPRQHTYTEGEGVNNFFPCISHDFHFIYHALKLSGQLPSMILFSLFPVARPEEAHFEIV